MARTDKDKPVWVRLRENLEAGLIDHDHRVIPERTRWAYWPDRDLSVTYYKWAQKEIHAHRALLESLGEEYTYEEVEEGSAYYFDELEKKFKTSPKTVRFTVRRSVSYEGSDGSCSADEFTESRPSGRCSPQWTDDLAHRWSESRKNRYSRAAVRDSLARAAALANCGDLDEYFSDPVLEEQYGPKVWTWED